MNKNIVISAPQYDRIDGRNAYKSDIKRLTLGKPTIRANKNMKLAMQIWKETPEGKLEISTELPIHQVFDLMIFLSRTLMYFGEAYRLPLLYDPEKPEIDRIGIQGDVMPITVCTENRHIKQDIQAFAQALNDIGEITGERLRVLSGILEEME